MNAIDEFWRVFKLNEHELAEVSSAESHVYQRILESLQQIHPKLFFEFHAEPGASEIIITADGDRKLFPLVETIVGGAPRIDGWTVFALKPRLGMPARVAWEGTRVSIADVVFEPLVSETSPQVAIRMFVPGISSDEVDDAHNALLRALDHALGERTFAEEVAFTEVFPLAENADTSRYLPLSEVIAYADGRKNRRSESD